jgi:hypothetical protein
VQQEQGALVLDAGVPPAVHRGREFRRFMGFVGEILDGVVVQQDVRHLPLGARIELVDAPLVQDAARREHEREARVHEKGRDDDGGIAAGIAAQHDDEHEADLDERRHDGEQAYPQQVGDAAGAAVDVRQQAADLAPGVETGAQRVQVGEGLAHIRRHRAQGHAREQQVAPFVELRAGEPQ